ncbi:hypothetical protein BU14_0022s0023 [Porphyra umbilicalis]|uniref:Uncharacterized protein n=1 Tax=Porphyra umbilicalis TaxID=2786 RepID=A0A1X6PKC5_PORUM|nr:hypothetical protein BU14_0022s0023 [Porphyra umbilicalis]|eukprot:OSX81302.1 hypothetical protein BU14_0022s0023 [Porphyra umbilicalis]
METIRASKVVDTTKEKNFQQRRKSGHRMRCPLFLRLRARVRGNERGWTGLYGAIKADFCLRSSATYANQVPRRQNTIATKGAQQWRKAVRKRSSAGRCLRGEAHMLVAREAVAHDRQCLLLILLHASRHPRDLYPSANARSYSCDLHLHDQRRWPHRKCRQPRDIGGTRHQLHIILLRQPTRSRRPRVTIRRCPWRLARRFNNCCRRRRRRRRPPRPHRPSAIDFNLLARRHRRRARAARPVQFPPVDGPPNDRRGRHQRRQRRHQRPHLRRRLVHPIVFLPKHRPRIVVGHPRRVGAAHRHGCRVGGRPHAPLRLIDDAVKDEPPATSEATPPPVRDGGAVGLTADRRRRRLVRRVRVGAAAARVRVDRRGEVDAERRLVAARKRGHARRRAGGGVRVGAGGRPRAGARALGGGRVGRRGGRATLGPTLGAAAEAGRGGERCNHPRVQVDRPRRRRHVPHRIALRRGRKHPVVVRGHPIVDKLACKVAHVAEELLARLVKEEGVQAVGAHRRNAAGSAAGGTHARAPPPRRPVAAAVATAALPAAARRLFRRRCRAAARIGRRRRFACGGRGGGDGACAHARRRGRQSVEGGRPKRGADEQVPRHGRHVRRGAGRRRGADDGLGERHAVALPGRELPQVMRRAGTRARQLGAREEGVHRRQVGPRPLPPHDGGEQITRLHQLLAQQHRTLVIFIRVLAPAAGAAAAARRAVAWPKRHRRVCVAGRYRRLVEAEEGAAAPLSAARHPVAVELLAGSLLVILVKHNVVGGRTHKLREGCIIITGDDRDDRDGDFQSFGLSRCRAATAHDRRQEGLLQVALLLLGGVHARRHGRQGAGDEDVIFVAQVLGRLDDREGLVQVHYSTQTNRIEQPREVVRLELRLCYGPAVGEVLYAASARTAVLGWQLDTEDEARKQTETCASLSMVPGGKVLRRLRARHSEPA